MKNIQILPPALKPARPVSPWPKTSEDTYILVISDTEDESEGEDDDDEGGEEVIYEGTKFESATTDGSS